MGSIQFDYYLHFKSLWQLKTQSFLFVGREMVLPNCFDFSHVHAARLFAYDWISPANWPAAKGKLFTQSGEKLCKFRERTYLSGTPAHSRPRRRHADFFKWLSKHFFFFMDSPRCLLLSSDVRFACGIPKDWRKLSLVNVCIWRLWIEWIQWWVRHPCWPIRRCQWVYAIEECAFI